MSDASLWIERGSASFRADRVESVRVEKLKVSRRKKGYRVAIQMMSGDVRSVAFKSERGRYRDGENYRAAKKVKRELVEEIRRAIGEGGESE